MSLSNWLDNIEWCIENYAGKFFEDNPKTVYFTGVVISLLFWVVMFIFKLPVEDTVFGNIGLVLVTIIISFVMGWMIMCMILLFFSLLTLIIHAIAHPEDSIPFILGFIFLGIALWAISLFINAFVYSDFSYE